jgi:hypothetical protein
MKIKAVPRFGCLNTRKKGIATIRIAVNKTGNLLISLLDKYEDNVRMTTSFANSDG